MDVEAAVEDHFDFADPAKPLVFSRHLPHQAVLINRSNSDSDCTSCSGHAAGVVAAAVVVAVVATYRRTRCASDRESGVVTDHNPCHP